MYQITIEGIAELQRTCTHLGRDLNQAVAKGINATAAKVVAAEKEAMQAHLDRPTPFTLNSLGIMKASPSHQVPAALVFVRPIAAEYLRTSIEGGTYEGLHPGDIRLNQYGNLPKRKGAPVGMSKLITNQRQFVGKIQTRRGKTLFGLFQRDRYKKVRKPWTRSHPAKVRPTRPIKVLVYADESGRVAIMPWFRTAAKQVEQSLGIDIRVEVDRLLEASLPTFRAQYR